MHTSLLRRGDQRAGGPAPGGSLVAGDSVVVPAGGGPL